MNVPFKSSRSQCDPYLAAQRVMVRMDVMIRTLVALVDEIAIELNGSRPGQRPFLNMRIMRPDLSARSADPSCEPCRICKVQIPNCCRHSDDVAQREVALQKERLPPHGLFARTVRRRGRFSQCSQRRAPWALRAILGDDWFLCSIPLFRNFLYASLFGFAQFGCFALGFSDLFCRFSLFLWGHVYVCFRVVRPLSGCRSRA